jgi:DnaK suppressor protein
VTTIEFSEFRVLLEDERKRLTNAVEFLQAENSGSIEDELGEIGSAGSDNFGSSAGATYERGFDQGLEDGAQQTLVEIDAALRRIDDGSYGTCELCGKPIGTERLRALPWARLCIDDQRRAG